MWVKMKYGVLGTEEYRQWDIDEEKGERDDGANEKDDANDPVNGG